MINYHGDSYAAAACNAATDKEAKWTKGELNILYGVMEKGGHDSTHHHGDGCLSAKLAESVCSRNEGTGRVFWLKGRKGAIYMHAAATGYNVGTCAR